jgi:hypothetical protein
MGQGASSGTDNTNDSNGNPAKKAAPEDLYDRK